MKKIMKRSSRATTSRSRKTQPSRVATALVLTIGLFANLFSFAIGAIPAHANASINLSTFDLTNASMTVDPLTKDQTGAGSFTGNHNIPGYIEGACIPFRIEVTNDEDVAEDVKTGAIYSFAANNEGVDDVEIVTPETTIPLNLNELTYTKTSLSTVTTMIGLVRGTNTTIAISVSPSKKTTGGNQVYPLTFNEVPANSVVDAYFCARLGVDASEAPGASLKIGVDDAGQQTVSIPSDAALPLPSLVINKTVVNDTNGAVANPSNFIFRVSPSPVALGTTEFTMPIANNAGTLTFENVFPGAYEVFEIDIPNNFTPSNTTTGTCVSTGAATATATLPTPTTTTATVVTCNYTNTATAPNNPPQTGVVNVVVTVVDAQDPTTSAEDFDFVLMSNQTLLQGPVTGAPAFSFAPIPATTVFSVQTALDLDTLFAQGFGVASTGACEGNMTAGANLTCFVTITRDPIVVPNTDATIQITKLLSNDDGTITPSPLVSEFQFAITLGKSFEFATVSTTQIGTGTDANGNPVIIGFISVPVPVATLDLFPGGAAYSITEVDDKGYDATSSLGCNGSITYGQTIQCEITNNDPEPIVIPEPAELITIINVINDNGGDAIPADFSVAITGGNPVPPTVIGSAAPGTSSILSPNTAYTTALTVDPATLGYAITNVSADCASSGIAEGETKTCIITLDDIQPTLIVRKEVVNDNTADTLPDFTAANFQLFVNGTPLAQQEENVIPTDAGTYTITETAHFGFRGTFSGDCDANGSVALEVGETKTCTLTNDDVDPESENSAILIVRKVVENDNGGTLGVQDFQLFVDGTPLVPQFENTLFVTAGPSTFYTVTETTAGNYIGGFSGDCNEDGEVSISAGETKICTLTNRDPGTPTPPGDGGPRGDTTTTITVITVVTNNDGKTLTATDFDNTLNFTNASAPVVTPGSTTGTTTTIDPGPFTVEGEDNADYTRSLSGDCAASAALGQDLICTITYDDKPAQGGGSGGGGTRVPEGGSGGTQSGFFPTPTPTPAPTPTPTPEPIVLGAEDEDTGAGGPEPELPRTGLPAGLFLALPLMLLASIRKNKK